MNLLRPILFSTILLLGIALITVLFIYKVDTPLKSSLAPFFQIIGEPVKALDVAATKVLPINEIDEKEYGDHIASYYRRRADPRDSNFIYINSLLKILTPFSDKSFNYRGFILNWNSPNACALPGGIILITEGLLDVLTTEGELMSVLAHEMGHIECGHCFGAVKFELLAKKIDAAPVGMIADFLNTLFFRHAYSKTQEAEADAFAYKAITRTKYSPSAVAGSFVSLQNYIESKGGTRAGDQSADLFRDYFISHPPLKLRIAKYEAIAKQWWAKNADSKRYYGKKNLVYRISLQKKSWNDEWTAAP